jgi:tRNA isopentenyltransferase (miaA)
MIYAIVGPTGVGKTKLSIMLAKKLNAVILNCDSMQVYKELNIGTAKITEEEKKGIKHYLFDIVSINDEFNAFTYQKLGRELIDKFLKEGKNIVIVGGTGLYLKALLYDYNFDDKKTSKKLYNFTLVALTRDRKKLYKDIDLRVDKMINSGLLEEAKYLYDNYKDSRALNFAIGYKELFEYFDGVISLEKAIENIKQATRRYAKRQFTFFKHQFDNVTWYDIDNISLNDIVLDITKKD